MRVALGLYLVLLCSIQTKAFIPSKCNGVEQICSSSSVFSKAPPGGLSFEEIVDVDEYTKSFSSTTLPTIPNKKNRGKVNEIDFCMSPSDFSLSRLYQTSSLSSNTPSSSSIASQNKSISNSITVDDKYQRPTMSLTRALNNASNRAVRRILLSRSWPSSEALNMSLRQVLAKESQTEFPMNNQISKIDNPKYVSEIEESTAKCPVPRPILNVIMRGLLMNKEDDSFGKGKKDAISDGKVRLFKNRGDDMWVKEQMQIFNETYGEVPGYSYAEAYMECVLSLATKGIESERVVEIMRDGVYEDAYRRLIAVLKSAGVVFEGIKETDTTISARMRIAKKLVDQDICLAMLDKINIKNEQVSLSKTGIQSTVDTLADIASAQEELRTAGKEKLESSSSDPLAENQVKETLRGTKRSKLAKALMSFFRSQEVEKNEETPLDITTPLLDNEDSPDEELISREDLGAVLLSAEEPTITRQLNILSNIVQRTLLFGGDEELLVLSETLKADQPAFIRRWYPHSESLISNPETENRPGVQFYNCMVRLLTDAYTLGVVTDMNPPFPLNPSYGNSYERLTAILVQFGSGYFKPMMNTSKKFSTPPKTPKEEFIRFREWEVSLRQAKPDVSDYPTDLIGSWLVKDQVGGKTIGTTTVVFMPEGEVSVDPPLRGLRWRLDPGPTHLDTCTFQVLSEDGAILEYKGFMDRGARLESRFSRRSIKVRGAVSLQMRDGDMTMNNDEYSKRDLLPLVSEPGVTRFVMSKVFDF